MKLTNFTVMFSSYSVVSIDRAIAYSEAIVRYDLCPVTFYGQARYMDLASSDKHL